MDIVRYSFRLRKFVTFFPFPSIPQNLSHFIFIIFSSGPHISLTPFHSHFIIKLIYKSKIHISLIFSTHFQLHFLKRVPGQNVTTKFMRRVGEYFINNTRSIIYGLPQHAIYMCNSKLINFTKLTKIQLQKHR